MAEVDFFVIGYAAAAMTFQVQHGGVVGRGVVRHQLGPGRVKNVDGVLKARQEQGRLAANQLGDAVTGEKPPAINGGVDSAYQPLFITNYGSCAWGEGEHVYF